MATLYLVVAGVNRRSLFWMDEYVGSCCKMVLQAKLLACSSRPNNSSQVSMAASCWTMHYAHGTGPAAVGVWRNCRRYFTQRLWMRMVKQK